MSESRLALDAVGHQAICEWIIEGETLTGAAARVGVSKASLLAWMAADEERATQVREARRLSASSWDERAVEVLEGAIDLFTLARARELASHYRWRASKIAPKDYGDKIAIGGADDLPPVEVRVSTLDTARRIAFLMQAGLAEAAALKGAAGVPQALLPASAPSLADDLAPHTRAAWQGVRQKWRSPGRSRGF